MFDVSSGIIGDRKDNKLVGVWVWGVGSTLGRVIA